jgi:hypothetical protein
MARQRREERDLRSLERPSMYSIFHALNPNERPFKNPLRSPWSSFGQPLVDEVPWKYALALAWLPPLLALVQIELWLQIPQTTGWLLVVAFFIVYAVAVVLVLRKR